MGEKTRKAFFSTPFEGAIVLWNLMMTFPHP
jgi:hypothetical protein